MKKIKQVILIAIAILLAVAVILFMLENRTTVSVQLFRYATPELPVAVYITFSLILGLLLSPLFTWLPLSRLRLANRKLRHELVKLKQENKQLTQQQAVPTKAELIVVDSKSA